MGETHGILPTHIPSESGPGFPVEHIRALFPALTRPPEYIFFDNAAGAQVPQGVLNAVNHFLVECNVQRGGRYSKSRKADEVTARARQSVADLVNARDANEIAFGMNATSFIRMMSLAIGQMLRTRNEIVVTDMDHEANVSPWLALQRLGAKIRWWRMRDDGNLHPEDLASLLSSKTRMVACTLASNALGSIVDVAAAATVAHEAGAELFVDAVHFGPHGLIDIQALECDYLVCSGYKMFAPHMGFLWGRRDLLQALPTFADDFIPHELPEKMEAGTFPYANVAGMEAAVEYLRALGPSKRGPSDDSTQVESRRASLERAFDRIRAYEIRLSVEMLTVLEECGAKVYGITEPSWMGERVPTFCFTLPSIAPAKLAEDLAQRGIAVRDGHMYTPRLMQRLGLTLESGAVRASLAHYNTREEIHKFGDALAEIARSS
jgi:cysteine desulfurase family protein (TIGR01976 family)